MYSILLAALSRATDEKPFKYLLLLKSWNLALRNDLGVFELLHAVEEARIMEQNGGMNKRRIIETLRNHRAELNAAGVVHLRVFGSVARDEASAESDVDLMADFDKSRRLTLVKIGSLQSRLTDLLGARVELSSSEWMREPVRSKALREAVLAF